MTYRLSEEECRNLDLSSSREWILTNGLGGYAMGTAAGLASRRYHGLLVAATRPPTERRLLWKSVEAEVRIGRDVHPLSTNRYPGAVHPSGYASLSSFEAGPDAVTWRHRSGRVNVTRALRLASGRNAAALTFRNEGTQAVELVLRPIVADRDHHGEFAASAGFPREVRYETERTEIVGDHVLTLHHPGARREPQEEWYYRFQHARERERGLPATDDGYCPCALFVRLAPGQEFTLVAETDGEGVPERASSPPLARGSLGAELREAVARFRIEGSPRTTLLAGYPWFTDWGRDTMISLPGACLVTGRVDLARRILRDYAAAERDGLIPNRFVEGDEEPEYHTVDGTLWFVNAVYRTLVHEWDDTFAAEMMPVLHRVFRAHVTGTRFGIRVDPKDGLLCQGEAGVQLTWMDAKIGEWVVTPRHGKPVEVAALWINAASAIAAIAEKVDGYAPIVYAKAAQKGKSHFEGRFWHEVRGHYLDTADPDDASLRPNQVLAMALPFSPCKPGHAARALEAVEQELWTPYGLRTLGPGEADYQGRFEGDMAERDASYHQGTAWPWLLGPYATALARHGGGATEARRVLRHAREMLREHGLGGIAEVYDGDAPQRPGGCPWQCWSVSEILRAWVEDAGGD